MASPCPCTARHALLLLVSLVNLISSYTFPSPPLLAAPFIPWRLTNVTLARALSLQIQKVHNTPFAHSRRPCQRRVDVAVIVVSLAVFSLLFLTFLLSHADDIWWCTSVYVKCMNKTNFRDNGMRVCLNLQDTVWKHVVYISLYVSIFKITVGAW